jgi:hypothetical protein
VQERGPYAYRHNGAAVQRCAERFRNSDYKNPRREIADMRRNRQSARSDPGFELALHPALSDQLVTLRRTFDERLIALEAGLARPDHGPSLESLVLDLARVAAEEAEAAARDMVRRVRREAAEQTAAATADAEETHTLLEAERARTALLHTELANLTEQLSSTIHTRQEADTGKQHEIEQLTATLAELRQAFDECTRAAARSAESLASEVERVNAAMRERDFFAQQRDAVTAERNRLAAERDALAAERDVIAAARDAATTERDALLTQRDSATAGKGVLETERDAAIADRDAALEEREVLAAERDALLAERDRLVRERDDFVRAHDAVLLQRDTVAHERDDIRQERDAEIQKLREELAKAMAAPPAAAVSPAPTPSAIEHAMSELQEMNGRHPHKSQKKQAAIEQAITELHEGGAVASASPSKKKSSVAKTYSAVRQADRQAFSNALGVQIDGEAALLVDLSVAGAQVLSCASLKPAKNVKMLLPSSEQPVLCRGKIVWARLEPTVPGKPIRYRAGMTFTSTDATAVQSFISRHGSRSSR